MKTRQFECLIWGTGNYCKQKINYLNNIKILAFIDRNRSKFMGNTTILPSEINNFVYDYIYVLSSHYLEIIREAVQEFHINPDKIIPGIYIKPQFPNELEIVTSNSEITVDTDGRLNYWFLGKLICVIHEESDFQKVKNIVCHEMNRDIIKSLNVNPVGKLFGLNRGGSIARYYVDNFIEKNQNYIRGNVLEIGDRTYTEKYGKHVDSSDVLHFDNTYSAYSDGINYDFYGDLRNGAGINKMYDCIILTQVLNFIDNVQNVKEVLVQILSPRGTLLITVAGITAISRYDMDRWGHYRNYTDLGLKRFLYDDRLSTEIEFKGNSKVACAFLQGMSVRELSKEDMDYVDEDFQIVVCAVSKKCSG